MIFDRNLPDLGGNIAPASRLALATHQPTGKTGDHPMKTMTVRLRAPDSLSVATLARTLNDLGCWVEAVPQHGTGAHAKRVDIADVIPLHRAPKWPYVCPEGAA